MDNATTTSSPANTTAIDLVTWQSSGNDRGTINIIWSCCITISLCCWVSTRPNAPALTDTRRHHLLDKLTLAVIGLLGPDFLFAIAAGQLSCAMRAKKLFHSDPKLLGGRKWSLRYSFFVDTGGFILTSPDFQEGFPIDSEQLYYLIKHGHLDFPTLTDQQVRDMDMVDTLSKLIALFQASFFTLTELMRIHRGLPMTTLELTTLSFSLTMIATSLCWFYKPEIRRPVVLCTKDNRLLADIREAARNTTHPNLSMHWYRTPLDFISRRDFNAETHFRYAANLSHRLHLHFFSRRMPSSGVWNRFPSDFWKPMDFLMAPFGASVWLGIGISFMCAWNFVFPTRTERILWRTCALCHLILVVCGGLLYIYGNATLIVKRQRGEAQYEMEAPSLDGMSHSHFGGRRSNDADEESAAVKDTTRMTEVAMNTPLQATPKPRHPSCSTWLRSPWFEKVRNLSPEGDPKLRVPLRGQVPILIGMAIYALCRVSLYVEDFASLRLQPAGVYVTVNQFLPFLN